VNIILYDNFVSVPGWFVDTAILFLYILSYILPYNNGFMYSEISRDQTLHFVSIYHVTKRSVPFRFAFAFYRFVNPLATGIVYKPFCLRSVCIPSAFRSRSVCVPFAFHLHFICISFEHLNVCSTVNVVKSRYVCSKYRCIVHTCP
jgi:hypothetical protein